MILNFPTVSPSSNRNYLCLLLFVTGGFLIGICFVWQVLTKVGPFSLKIYQVPMLAGFALLLFPAFRRAVREFTQFAKPVLLSMMVLVLVYGVSLFWTTQHFTGVLLISQQVMYGIFFIIFGSAVWELIRLNRIRCLIISTWLAFILFLTHVGISVYNWDTHTKEEFRKELALRRVAGVDRVVSGGISRYAPLNLYETNYRHIEFVDHPNIRNAIAINLFLLFAVVVLFEKRRSRKWISALIVFGIVLTLSRSGLLALFVCTVCSFLLRPKTKTGWLRFVLAALGISIFTTLTESGQQFANLVAQRLTLLDDGVNLRYHSYMEVLRGPIEMYHKGYGIGTKMTLFNGELSFVHNFILGSLYSAGIAGLLAAVWVLCSLLSYPYRVIRQTLQRQPSPSSQVTFALSIPIILVLWSQIGGANGLMGAAKWALLSVSLVVLLNTPTVISPSDAITVSSANSVMEK